MGRIWRRYREWPEGGVSHKSLFPTTVIDPFGHVSHGGYYCYDYPRIRRITDTVGRPKRYNRIDQVDLTVYRLGASTFRYTSGTVWSVSPYLVPVILSETDLRSKFTIALGHGLNSVECQDFVNDSFFTMSQDFGRGFDFYNSLRDIIEVKQLVWQFKGLLFRCYHLFTDFLRFAGRLKGTGWSLSKLREAAREPSNALLVQKFGVESSLRDLEETFRHVVAFKSRLEELRRLAGKTRVLHTSKSFSVPYSDLNWTTSVVGNARFWFRNPIEKIEYTCTAVVRYKKSLLEQLDGLLGEFYALERSMGLGRGVEFLWDLVPFSFVANWFARYDKWIRNNVSLGDSLDLLEIVDSGVSFKSTFSAHLTLEGGFLDRAHDIADVTLRQYNRLPGLKVDRNVYSNWSNLGSSQLAILAALVGQRV